MRLTCVTTANGSTSARPAFPRVGWATSPSAFAATPWRFQPVLAAVCATRRARAMW